MSASASRPSEDPARRGAITFVLSRENERGAAFPFERARQPPGAPCSTDTSRSQARDSSRSSWRARRVLRARGARLDVRRARAPRPRRSDHPRRFRARESEDRVSARRDTLTRATRRQKKGPYPHHSSSRFRAPAGTSLSPFVATTRPAAAHSPRRRRRRASAQDPPSVKMGKKAKGKHRLGASSLRRRVPCPRFPPARRASVSRPQPPPPRR